MPHQRESPEGQVADAIKNKTKPIVSLQEGKNALNVANKIISKINL